MNKSLLISLALLSVALTTTNRASSQGLQVTDTLTDQELVELLVGGGLQISNITVTCADSAYGSFDGTACNVGMNSGMLLTSGSITNAMGPNDEGGVTVDNFDPGDSMLTQIANNTSYDACVFEFDLIPIFDTLVFNYVFGSDEYLEFVNAGYNDVFAFFISGPGIAGVENIALVPGSTTPVSIDNVNDVTNPAYYIDNGDGFTPPQNGSPFYIQYDGFTTVLQAKRAVQPCQTYHLRLAVADVGDGILDSGVFIEGGSLQSTGVKLSVGSSAGGGFPYAIEGCTDGLFTFDRTLALPTSETIHFVIAGTATNGTDYPITADSVVIPANQTSASLTITPIADGQTEGQEHMVIYLVDPCFGGYVDSAYLYFLDEMNVQVSADPSICEGDSVEVWATGGTIFDWQPAAGLSDNTSDRPVAFPTTTTTYTVQVTADACVDSGFVTVNVNPSPPVDAGPDISMCIDGQALLNATGAVSYSWTPAADLSDPNIANPTATPNSTTTYMVTGIDANGCEATDAITVTVNPLPNAQAWPDTTICEGDIIQLHSAGGAAYHWSPQQFLNSSTVADPNAFPDVTTTFTVVVTDANGCESSAMLTVTVKPSPNVEAGQDTTILAGQSAFLSGTTSGVAFNWIPPNGLSDPNILDPVATPIQTTTYSLVATTIDGCDAHDSVTVIVLNDAHIYIPNAFSPNNDGINDYLWVRSLGIVDLEFFRIYNRWGEVVFETTDQSILTSETSGWNGTASGKVQPMGVYAFVLKGLSPQGDAVLKSGNITLIR